MYSVFPDLLSYWMFVPTFLRFVAGAYFLSFAFDTLFKNFDEKAKLFKHLGLRPEKLFLYCTVILEIISAISLLAGVFTQVSAGILAVIAGIAGFVKIKTKSHVLKETDTYTLLVAILLSLMVTGAGYLAIDYPF